jgi:hypothetical protein
MNTRGTIFQTSYKSIDEILGAYPLLVYNVSSEWNEYLDENGSEVRALAYRHELYIPGSFKPPVWYYTSKYGTSMIQSTLEFVEWCNTNSEALYLGVPST